MNYFFNLLNITQGEANCLIILFIISLITLYNIIKTNIIYSNSVFFIPHKKHEQSFLIKPSKTENKFNILIKRVFMGRTFYSGFYYYDLPCDLYSSCDYFIDDLNSIDDAKKAVAELKLKVKEHHFNKNKPLNKKLNTIEA
jgi:hypothetical protein